MSKINFRQIISTRKVFFAVWLGAIALLCCALSLVIVVIGFRNGSSSTDNGKYAACDTLSSDVAIITCSECIDKGNVWSPTRGCVTSTTSRTSSRTTSSRTSSRTTSTSKSTTSKTTTSAPVVVPDSGLF